MNESKKTSFFLGANTPNGFYSLYDEYTGHVEDFFYYIKAGPGCGKSSFMKRVERVLEREGVYAERIYCSADPDSLDGVYFPELKIGIVDATAPHILEPACAGVSGCYVNLGAFYDLSGLRTQHDEIRRLNTLYKNEYTKAYRLLKSASQVEPAKNIDLHSHIFTAIEKRAKGIVSREFKKSNTTRGITKHRFLNGLCFKGRVCLYDTVPCLASRVYTVDNDLGLAPHLMELLKTRAAASGWNSIACLSPDDPEKTLHLIIPELDLAFVSQTSGAPYPYEAARHLRLDASVGKDVLSPQRALIKQHKKAYETLMYGTIEHLKAAKTLHDDMESAYNPYVDFDGIYSLADKYASAILQK